MPFTFGGEHVRVLSLIPFQELFINGAGVGGSVLKEGISNVLLFVAGGAIFAYARQNTILTMTLFLAGVAIIIEAGQFILNIGRVSSIDDVIWAALGLLIEATIIKKQLHQELMFQARHKTVDVNLRGFMYMMPLEFSEITRVRGACRHTGEPSMGAVFCRLPRLRHLGIYRVLLSDSAGLRKIRIAEVVEVANTLQKSNYCL